jgi:lambda repressor-like predicted transcriptional regulator
MSTSITGVSAVQDPTWMDGPGGRNPMKQVMAGAASLLGMGDDELRSALRSGSTLASLAKDRGVSQDDLVAAVRSGLEAAGPPPAAKAAQGADLTAMATDIVNGTGPARHHGPHGPHGPRGGDRDGDGDGADMAQRLQSLTSALGMDESSFFDALSSGTSLKDLAAQHDVSSDQLRSLLLGPVKVDATA